jgi:hypothetical protein
MSPFCFFCSCVVLVMPESMENYNEGHRSCIPVVANEYEPCAFDR